MIEKNIKKTCKKHGYTVFKHRNNKKREWYVCELCLKAQWRKAADKRRKKPEVKKYHKEYTASFNKIRKSLSIYLTMILIATKQLPE